MEFDTNVSAEVVDGFQTDHTSRWWLLLSKPTRRLKWKDILRNLKNYTNRFHFLPICHLVPHLELRHASADKKNQHFNSGGDTTQLLGHFPLSFVPSPASKSSVGSSWCDWLEENLYEFSVGKYCALRTVVQGGPEKSKPLPNHQKIVLNEIRFIRQWD